MLRSASGFRISVGAVVGLMCFGTPEVGRAQPLVQQAESEQSSPCEANHPPTFVRVLPERFDQPSATVKVGVPVELTLAVLDPDGDRLELRALALPEGASFSRELGKLTWTPSSAQVGNHAVRFEVSDGRKQATKTLLFDVRENRAPVFFPRQYQLSIGQFGHLAFAADDADDDALSYAVDPLPQGATFDSTRGVLHWQPKATAAGSHQLELTVSDGVTSVTHDFLIQVVPANEDAWAAFLRPRIGAVLYRPPPSTDVGTFFGVSAHLSLVSWMHHTESPGPSHGGVYLGIESMASTAENVASLFSYLGGFYLSFERNVSRHWLIPFYGTEFGGFVQEQLGKPFHFTLFGGLQLFANRSFVVSLRGGYRSVPARPNELSGLHACATVDWFDW